MGVRHAQQPPRWPTEAEATPHPPRQAQGPQPVQIERSGVAERPAAGGGGPAQSCRPSVSCPVTLEDVDSVGLRRRIHELEKEKLELTSQHNQEILALGTQVARLRAQVERGEAVRQTLEYDITVANRGSALQRSKADAAIAELREQNADQQGLLAELRQRTQDLEKALEISRRAREEDVRGLQAELAERDRLLLAAQEEAELATRDEGRLLATLQEQQETLRDLERRMDAEWRGREDLRQQADERERTLHAQLESALRRVKDLESDLQADRDVHLEAQRAAHVIQASSEHRRQRLQDLEAELQQEKSRRRDLLSSLERQKEKNRELEQETETTANTHARTQSAYLRSKEDLEQQRKSSSDLRDRLTHTQQQLSGVEEQLVCVQKASEGFMTDLEQLLLQHSLQGETLTHSGEHQPSALLDLLKKILSGYQSTLSNTESQLRDAGRRRELLLVENGQKEEVLNTQKINLQDSATRLAQLTAEVTRLHGDAAASAKAAAEAQSDLRHMTQRHAHTQREIQRISRENHKQEQEKLVFLHSLYQKLVAGCVLLRPPQGILGSFTWAELCAVLQEHTEGLLSDLHTAKEQIERLRGECEAKSGALRELHEAHGGAVEGLTAQLRLREQSWISQREELLQHQEGLTAQLHHRAQESQRKADHAAAKLCSVGRDSASLLSACSLLAGCVSALFRRASSLWQQKHALLRLAESRDTLDRDVRVLLQALCHSHAPPPHTGVWRFRCAAIAVLAALRLRTLGTHSRLLVTVETPHTPLKSLGVFAVGGSSGRSERMAWIRSEEMKSEILTCMQGAEDCTESTVHTAFSRLIDRLVVKSDSTRQQCSDGESLSWRLGRGQQRLQTTRPVPTNHYSSKAVTESLQHNILEFTRRLHSAEVERRSLRLEVARLKGHQSAGEEEDGRKHAACVPAARLQGLLVELGSALEREQQAQDLLHQQATQLQQLGLSMELHAGDQQEKDHTLSQAVKSLSECKAALRKKDQSLRQLSKYLSQSQREKRELQEDVIAAEKALCRAARTRDSVVNYLQAVESSLEEVRGRVLSQTTPTKGDVTWHLPRMHLDVPDPEGLTGGPEVVICEGFVRSFAGVYEVVCSRLMNVQSELDSRNTLACVLKSELHNAGVSDGVTGTGAALTPPPPREAVHCGIRAPPKQVPERLCEVSLPINKSRNRKSREKQ
ncbi:coiled-coil domain-containing protein 171 isoform X2 [Denticeps clupeoides]|uniref:coiled-coil domain-containing protein 171 isoform X2 n=1 Tax=Denticeps clupeoides TaxID=299321 RepID=UPI0010A54AF8|nr:coiled-coil domain-containing protein 171-like isoform X2 [Denticeps clupeoides]